MNKSIEPQSTSPFETAVKVFALVFVGTLAFGVITGAPEGALIPLLFGAFLGAFIVAAVVFCVKAMKAESAEKVISKTIKIVAFTLVAGLLALRALPAAAQTPVPLEIPTNVIFSETNNWLETFAPIAAIGIGISIALAVLGYLGKMIVSAFRG